MKGLPNTKTVLFTFDYELFLGDNSGRPQECLIPPTDQLLHLLDQSGYKGIFFVDTTYLIRLQQEADNHSEAARDLSDIRQQLTRMVQNGHYIFPHIHPHWLDAEYDSKKNEWSLKNTRYYRFAAIDAGQQDRLFEASMQIIRAFTDGVAGYQIDCYRAGGWSLQPFSHFDPFFLKYGITSDWSVIPGKYQFSDANYFDFRNAPEGLPVYAFGDDPCVQEQGGRFTEWTISTMTMTPFENWLNFKVSGLLKRMGKSRRPSGSTVTVGDTTEGDSLQQGKSTRRIVSFEGLNPFTLRKHLSAIRRQSYYHFISHPKLLTPFEFSMIGKLFEALKKEGPIQSDFRKAVVR